MAGSLTALSHNGIASGTQTVSKSGSERQVKKDVGDLGKALAANDVAAAQSAVNSLKQAAPTQNSQTDFNNAVKALDQALKSNNARGAAEAFASLQQAQKQVTRERASGPAQDQPNRPRVSGADATAIVEKRDQVQQQRQSSDKAFITRQDLAAKSAQAKPRADVGGKIDTQA